MTNFFNVGHKSIKGLGYFALTFLASALILVSCFTGLPTVKAQGQDGVYVYESCGGSVLVGGVKLNGGTTYNYTDGSTVTFNAVPITGFNFLCWDYANSTGTSTSTDNPFNYKITSKECAVQPLFTPAVNASLASTTSQTGKSPFEMLISIGGTTSPVAATYTNYSIGDIATFTAKAGQGFKFLYWLVPAAAGGSSVSTSNPLKFNVTAEACAVQAYFIPQSSTVTLPSITPAGSPTPTPKVPEFSTATAVMIATIILLFAVGTYAYRKRK